MSETLDLIAALRDNLALPPPPAERLIGGDVLDDQPDHAALARAAVLVPIVLRDRPTVIFTRRTDHLPRHAGQVSFPGGRIDPGDDGPVAAALREAHEEIGLEPALVEVVGIGDPYVTVTGFHITPVIGLVQAHATLTPQAGEVAAVFEVPLDHLLEPANHIEQAIEWQGRDRHYYEIQWDEQRIWGATAGMVVNLGRRLAYRP
jgi:8-oxo-dGTP pyrophosphatase MutT (NUDIX family)